MKIGTVDPVGTFVGALEASAVYLGSKLVKLFSIPGWDGLTFTESSQYLYDSSESLIASQVQMRNNGQYAFGLYIGLYYGLKRHNLTVADSITSGMTSDKTVTDAGITAFAVSSNGLRLYLAIGTTLNHYTLATAYDIESKTLQSSTACTNDIQGMEISTDGTKLIEIVKSSNTINQYDLSTPFDTSTRIVANTFNFFTETGENIATRPDISLSSDGTKLVIANESNLHCFYLGVPFSLENKTLSSEIKSDGGRKLTGIAFKENNKDFAVVDGSWYVVMYDYTMV